MGFLVGINGEGKGIKVCRDEKVSREPDVNAKGTHRAPRIKQLHRKVVALAKERKLKVGEISGTELRRLLLNNEDGTKQEMAELLAKQFPDELASRLPPKRALWKSEDARMDIFDAVELAVCF